MTKLARLVCAAGLLLAVLAACTPATAPKGGLEYSGPTEQTVQKGQMVPGTNIQYVSNSQDGAVVLIGGQQAIKKTGDSLDWHGSPVPGVSVALAQRVVRADDQSLLTAGTVQIVIEQTSPAEAAFPDKPLYTYQVPVAYVVNKGQAIPGTTIVYAGKGNEGAQLTGVTGYPYRKLADSISWRGRLRADAFLDTTVRVLAYTDEFMQVTGLATIGLIGEE